MKTRIAIIAACLVAVGCRQICSPSVELENCLMCTVLIYNGTVDAAQGQTIPTDLGRGASVAAGPAAQSGAAGNE